MRRPQQHVAKRQLFTEIPKNEYTGNTARHCSCSVTLTKNFVVVSPITTFA